MRKLTLLLTLFTTALSAQNLGFNGAGFFENYDKDVEQYLLDMNQPFTLRVPGGAISKFHDPYNVKKGWGMTEASITDWFQRTGFDEDGNGLEKWLRKTADQPNHSYLDDLIRLQKTFPNMTVLYVLNVLNSTPEANMAAVSYLMQNNVKVVGVEAGNEVYGKYASFAEYIKDFEPIVKLMRKTYPQIKIGLVAGANTGRKEIEQWNNSLALYAGSYDAVILHYYYTQRELGDSYNMIPLKSEYDASASNTELDKAFKMAATQLMEKKLLEDGITYAQNKFFHKSIWITEWNTKPSEMLNNTIVNAAWQFKEMVELRQRIEFFCIHNGVGPDKYGMITKSTQFDNSEKDMLKRLSYYSYILASEIENGKVIRANEKFIVQKDDDGEVCIYFTNMKDAYTALLEYNGNDVESSTINYISGSHLYSSAGTTGYMGKGTKAGYEITGIKREKFTGIIPANSFGYIIIKLKK